MEVAEFEGSSKRKWREFENTQPKQLTLEAINAKHQAAAVRREVRADMPDMLRACRPWPLLQGRTPADEALLHFVRATVLHGSAVAVRHAASHTTSRSRQILPVARTGCLNRGSAAYR
jgi:hypothetical protein